MIKLTPQKPPYYEIIEPKFTYIALISQDGTNPPVANVLTNTLGEIVWTYDSVGNYTGTLTDKLPQGKTTIEIANTTPPDTMAYAGDNGDNNSVYISTVANAISANGVLLNNKLTITVN